MSGLANLTPFAAAAVPARLLDGREAVLVLMSARFHVLGRGGRLERASDQPPPPLADVYFGDPRTSSLRVAGQSDCLRPGTDIYVSGHARAPYGKPCTALNVRARVGPVEQRALVIGDRRWRARPAGEPVPSKAAPFESIPLTWEHAFGGTWADEDAVHGEPRNPVGRGFVPRVEDADAQLLPNIERPESTIERVEDRPEPIGFGPVARGWESRSSLAGTYDESWVRERAPWWPDDLDPRFFHAAAKGLQSAEPLQGGERVELEGMHPDGLVSFPLPRLQWEVENVVDGRFSTSASVLSAVHLEPDEEMLTMLYRSIVVLPRGLLRWGGSTVRSCVELPPPPLPPLEEIL